MVLSFKVFAKKMKIINNYPPRVPDLAIVGLGSFSFSGCDF
jgi:hypothetical protein